MRRYYFSFVYQYFYSEPLVIAMEHVNIIILSQLMILREREYCIYFIILYNIKLKYVYMIINLFTIYSVILKVQ
jgi:hypothetical protein